MTEIRLNLPKLKFDELKQIALNVGNSPTDYLRSILFRHLLSEAEKAKDNEQ